MLADAYNGHQTRLRRVASCAWLYPTLARVQDPSVEIALLIDLREDPGQLGAAEGPGDFFGRKRWVLRSCLDNS